MEKPLELVKGKKLQFVRKTKTDRMRICGKERAEGAAGVSSGVWGDLLPCRAAPAA